MVTTDFTIFPRIVDCFPPLKPLPGCSVPPEQPAYSSSLSYSEKALSARHVMIPTPSDDEEIAIPSGMPPSTRMSDLPTTPPPSQYWKLKKLDPSAHVMDYWIRSSHGWDIDGIESDISVCIGQANNIGIS
jgi:hypothetical protein